MTFRLRPSSKKSTETESSLIEFPKPLPHTFISNEIITLKHLSTKLQILQNNFHNLNQNLRRDHDISNTGYIDVQKRLDLLQYKSFTNEKDIQQLIDINRNNFNPLPPLKNEQQSFGKNQIAILKQTLLQERESQKEQIKHMSAVIQQMSYKQLKIQQQLRETFNRTREQYENRFSDQSNQIQKVDQYKMRKIDQQYEIMKENMGQIEKRIYQELQTKIRKQTILKDFVQQKMQQVRDQIAVQQKQLINAETKLTRETKQSLESLFSMVKNLKTTFSQELSQTQQLSVNNIKRLSMNLDILNQKLSERLKVMQDNLIQNQGEISQFKQWVVNKLDENRQIMMGLEEEAVERMENSSGNHQTNGGVSSSHLQEKFAILQKDLHSWKSLTEQKNLMIFKQISQSLKQMKVDYKKQNDQFSSELISLTESMRALKKSIPNDMKKISQTIVTIFNDQFDVLAEQMDLLTEMLKVSKQQTEKFTKDEIKKHKEAFLQQVKALITTSKKQLNLSLQKSLIKSQQNQKSSLQKQSTYIQSLSSQKFQAIESQMKDTQSQSKKMNVTTASQLQSFTLSMKQFNQNYKQYLEEQRKEDLKKRIELEQNMRKNASNLMEVAYKKSEFLVQGMKNAIQMNFMKDKLENKQQIQTIRNQVNKGIQHQKEQFVNSIKQFSDKLTSQRKSSQTHLENSFNENVNNLKKSLSTQINDNIIEMEDKLKNLQGQTLDDLRKQMESISDINRKFNQFKNQQEAEIKKLKKIQQEQILASFNKLEKQMNMKTQTLEKQISELCRSILNQTNSELEKFRQKIIQIEENIEKQKKQQQNKSQSKAQALQAQMKKQIQKQIQQASQRQEQQIKQLNQTLSTIRETVWKLQAMNFSEQAKNKALFDRIGDDMNQLSLNIEVIGKQINAELQKKDSPNS